MSIAEPAAGTGGMLRAAAQVIREAGHDPAEMLWVANDIAPLPVACMAVNCHVWGLGHGVVLGTANSLAEPDWYGREWDRQRAAVEHRDSIARAAVFITATRRAERLITGEAGPDLRNDLEAEITDPAACPNRPRPDGKWDKILPSEDVLFDAADLGEPAPAPARRGGRARRPAEKPPDTETLF